MKRRLIFEIDVTDTACSSPNGLCKQMWTSGGGTRFLCRVFGDKELCDQYGEPSGEGTLQRLKECIAAEDKVSKKRRVMRCDGQS